MRYVLVLALLTSCTPLYLPATRNAPLFDEGGEAQVTGVFGAAGVEAQGAYALTDNIVAIGSYSYANQKKTSNGKEYTRKNGYAEIGLGLYNTTRSSRWEIIAGYGFGESTSSDVYGFVNPGVETLTTAKLKRIFIQPSIGTKNRGTNLSFTPKVSWVDFSDFTDASGVVYQPTDKAVIFLEPAATLKFHLKGNIFAIAQLGVTFPLSGEPYFKYQPLSASFGLQIDTGGLSTKVYK